MENILVYFLVVCACGALSFFFSGMEAGVFALNRLRIRQRMRAGDPRAKLLLHYLENPEDFLWTILVGNTLSNFTVVCLLMAGLNYWAPDHRILIWSLFAVGVLLLYALGDLLPKLLFQRIPNRLCLFFARPFRLVHLGLSPLIALITSVSHLLLRWTGGRTFTGRLFGNREELRMVMQESAQGLTSDERSMINRVLDLQTAPLSQVTVPIRDVVTATLQTPMSEVFRLCRERGLTRLPLWETRGLDRRIAGIVSLKDLLYRADLDAQRPAGEYLKPAMYLDEDTRIEAALRLMQKSGQRMAIILGRDQHELGIVCLQDILRAIFGEVSL